MSTIGVKKLLDKLSKKEGVSYVPATLGSWDSRLFYSEKDGEIYGELIYLTDDIFKEAIVNKDLYLVEEPVVRDLAAWVLSYSSFGYYTWNVMGIDCGLIVHGYFSKKDNRTIMRPVFIVVNEDLMDKLIIYTRRETHNINQGSILHKE